MTSYPGAQQPIPPPPGAPPPPGSRPPRRRSWFGALVALVGAMAVGFFIVTALLVAVRAGSHGLPGHLGKNRIGVVYVSGMIVSGGGGGSPLFGGLAGSDEIIHQLRSARKDRGVKAIVIRINSPGGSAAASQEIYQEVMRVREGGQKVIVSMGDVAASGGYYIAAAADRIVANRATLTGSIGVIMEMGNMEGLYKKIGYRPETIKSGPHKDIGSPSRPMTAEERAMLQELIDDVYDQFLEDVSRGRRIPQDKLKPLADGRVFTGRQAKENGLVDELGGFRDAVRIAAHEAGISGEPELTDYRSTSLLQELLGATAPSFAQWFAGRMTRHIDLDQVRQLMYSLPPAPQ